MAEEEDAWKKIATDQKVQHKSWKARSEGYKECVKNFRIWDEGSPEFNKYLGLVKKFVTDSNELVRIQGLEAVLLFVENAQVAKKTCGEVVSGIILKCLNTKPRLKEAAMEVCLMYVEIDRNELTQEELTKGFTNKQPKVATACLEIITKAFSLFGSKVIQAKPLLKEIPKLADHRDKNVRDAVKALAVEIYRWVGPAIKTPLQNINAVMLKELEEEWAKADTEGKPTQTRFMRSQQDLREKMEAKAAAAVTGGDAEGAGPGGEAAEEQAEVDAYELLDPVEILSKLPKNFYEQIEAKKWQERKEMLEACQKLCESPKIEPGEFGDLVRALKKVIAKDTNVMLVTIAAKCIAGLARGIRKKFQPYSVVCCDAIFEKFKEKKPAVIAALQEAIDAVYLSTTIQALNESIGECLNNKNPSIREQTGLFVARALAKTKPSALNKATIKPLVQALLKNIDHSAPNVRDATYQALGMLLKLVSEKVMLPFIVDLDNLKLDKIKEYAGKAVVKGKVGTTKPAAVAPPPEQQAKPAAKQKVVKGGGKAEKGGPKKAKAARSKTDASQSDSKPQEPVLGDLAVEEQINEFLGEEVLKQVQSANWKERLEGLQSLSQKLKLTDVKSIPCQAIIKTLGSGKPGWKDNNFNCLNEKFAILKNLAENASFSKTSAELCLPALIEKIGDVKSGKASKEAVTAAAGATSFPWVSESVMEMSMSHKNPKIQAESLSWLSEAIKEFGIAGVNVKLVIAKIKIAFAGPNPAVKTAAFSVLSTLTLYIGPKIRMFFESEKPALLQQIDAEIEKCKGSSPPAPTRGAKSSSNNVDDSDEGDEESTATFKVEDLVPRVNIADSITDGLISKLSAKEWKVRKEGLEEVIGILNEAKFVEPTIGELAPALKLRLGDSNKILVATTLTILTQLATALGAHCSKHVKTVAPGLVAVLADGKPNVRQNGLNAMNEWHGNTSLSLWFEDEIISTALSVPKHMYLRIELLNWLSDKLLATPKLTSSAKEGMEACVKHLYACCEDRTADVRAKAQAALPAFMYHLGIDKMTRMCGKLSPTSVNVITALLDKSKELVPARKTTASKKGKPPPRVDVDIGLPGEEPKETSSKTSVAPKQKESTTSVKSTKSKRPAASKKAQEEPEVGPALVKIPNGKEQRIKDEQKLKTLKWVFDTPREELTSQLRSQLTTCVSGALATELFHSDFQRHIKALSILTQAMEQQWDETIGTLDLIFRWVTLRFYEKNTTVHIKCLEYLKKVFSKLEEANFRLTDSEASSFIPHLITKIGEPKENIRKDVHTIMQQTTRVYPASKVFGFLMQGLGTKNSRQKTECLDELGILITSYGVEVCQPSPPKALREVATHIGDRDNSVRSAALNVAVAAYNSCGDLVYKYVGKLNEKDMSMLEERIKRSGKFSSDQPPAATQQKLAPVTSAKSEPKMQKLLSKPANIKPEISTSDLHSSASRENKVDENQYKLPELLDTECADLLNEPDFVVPQRFSSRTSDFQERGSSASADATLTAVITGLASSDIDESLKSTHQLDAVLAHLEQKELLKPRVDQIVTTSCIQIRLATNRYLSRINPNVTDMEGEGDADHILAKVMSLYKSLFAIDYQIFKDPSLAVLVTQDTLQDFTHAIIMFLLDKRVNDLPECQRIISMLNVMVVHMVENTNPTLYCCALIRIMHSSMEGSANNVRQLVCKCMWKAFRSLETFLFPPEGSLKPPLQPSQVLAEIDRFFVAHPTRQLSHNKTNDTHVVASRTLRSVVVTLCEKLGLGILDEVKTIENIESSELMSVIKKQLKISNPASAVDAYTKKAMSSESSDKKENVGIQNGDVSPEKQLSMIVKKVGNREQTKQGLQELYDFKLKYPDYDIESGFTNLTPLFSNYIKRSLATIEQDRAAGVTDTSSILKSTNKNLKAKDYLERIKMLRTKCGLPIDHLSQSNSDSRVLSSNSNALNHESNGMESERQLHAPLIKPTGPGTSHEMPENTARPEPVPQRPSTASNVEELKQRLEKIKRERKRY